MDEQNVHQFWGASPAINLLDVPLTCNSSILSERGAVNILQICPSDARHTIYTMSKIWRYTEKMSGVVNIYVFEDAEEILARHLLMLCIYLDETLLTKERMEIFLEVFGNALLREKTAQYLDSMGRKLEGLIVDATSQGAFENRLKSLFDFSVMKFTDKDKLADVFKRYRQQVPYDMVKAWDNRCRKWYQERYDFRKNMIDYDYHMRMVERGTPGQNTDHGSIIHYHHFRYWRLHGIAYELRDCVYNQPNRSMISTAYGRTKEFKDRNLKDVGRSVSAVGYWGCILNSPYLSFGVASEDQGLLAFANKQYTHTAVDVSEYNILSCLHELRTGTPMPSSSGATHRADAARGPTSLEKLAEANKGAEDSNGGKERKAAGSECGSQQDAASASSQPPLQKEQCVISEVSDERPAAGSHGSQSVKERQSEASRGQVDEGPTSTDLSSAMGAIEISATETSGRLSEDNAGESNSESGTQSRGQDLSTSDLGITVEGVNTGTSEAEANAGAAGESSTSTAAAVPVTQSASSTEQPSVSTAASEAEAALRAKEAELDAAAWERCKRFRIIPVLGDLTKQITGKSKFGQMFDLISIGHRHIHLLGPEHKLAAAATPQAVLVVETADNLVQLKKEQARLFSEKIVELAKSGGWSIADGPTYLEEYAHLMFKQS